MEIDEVGDINRQMSDWFVTDAKEFMWGLKCRSSLCEIVLYVLTILTILTTLTALTWHLSAS